MSAYTTITITREEALRRISSMASELNNQKLADIMDVIGRDSLYNYFVVDYIEKEEHGCEKCRRVESD